MRASIRGSIRSVMVTDSEASALPAVAASIRRKSGRFSDQKFASASSLSKSGTSSQLAKVCIFLFHTRPHPRLRFFCFEDQDEDDDENDFLRQRLIHFPLVKKSFFRLERPRVQDADGFSVGAIHAGNPNATCRHSEVEKARLNAESRRVRQQPHSERILKRFLNFPLSQRTVQLERRIVPIELHNG